MTQWYVKDLSKLTGVSVQTLHHYDRIDLLTPSLRMENGYRVYSEKDLLKLQQIIALKYFGFELVQIKALLAGNAETLQQFSVQSQFLERKAHALLDASKALKSIISTVKDDKSIPWETIIKLIEVYRMTQQLEHEWVKEIFTPDELKQYAAFESELKSKFTPAQRAALSKQWDEVLEGIKRNINNDPTSEAGILVGKQCMEFVISMYGRKYAHLRNKKFEKGFAEGKGLDDVNLTPEMVTWLEQAVDAYWRKRIYSILAQVGKLNTAEILRQWNEVLDEMYGDETARKTAVLNLVLQDDKVSDAAKKLLKGIL